jgi:CBS domain-containing protein
MQAIDIMTPSVITATPDTPIGELIRLMLSHQVSALPIVDGTTLVGIVSESDLIRRAELGTEKRPSHWLELITSRAHLAADYVHTHGHTARQVMTAPVVTVADTTPVAEIAALLESRHIKRVPVLRDGQLVGIVSRANLLRALACRITQQVTTDDRTIRDRLLEELRTQPWGGALAQGNVVVQDGVVHLWGYVDSQAERAARIVAAEGIPGVRLVEDHTELWHTPDPLDRPNWPTPAPP